MLLAHRHMVEWIHATDGEVDSCYWHIDTARHGESRIHTLYSISPPPLPVATCATVVVLCVPMCTCMCMCVHVCVYVCVSMCEHVCMRGQPLRRLATEICSAGGTRTTLFRV